MDRPRLRSLTTGRLNPIDLIIPNLTFSQQSEYKDYPLQKTELIDVTPALEAFAADMIPRLKVAPVRKIYENWDNRLVLDPITLVLRQLELLASGKNSNERDAKIPAINQREWDLIASVLLRYVK